MTILQSWWAKIGVLELFGLLAGNRRIATYIELLKTLGENSNIKSVIISVDSPGGLATASDYLYSAIGRLAAKKPVVAFISGSGTSGAYLVSCAAHKIVTLPSAVIGSIGVISSRPVLERLLERIGVRVSVTKSGPLKDMGAFYREPSEEEKQKEQELINSYFDYFVKVVAKGRHMEMSRVRELATGEVFLGEKAKGLGLVDEVGDFDNALDLAAQLGKVRRRFGYVRPRRGFAERLVSRFAISFLEETLELGYLLTPQIYYLG
jgi:protease-4